MKLKIDDANIDIEERGNGDAIVLLHGFPLTREIWDEQFESISRTHRAIRLDLRGMGASSSPPGPYLMESLAGDVAGVLDALGVERATLVGHSLGGYVALAFARMYVERVAGLALVCSRLAADTPEQAHAREELAERMERENSVEPAVEMFLPRVLPQQTIAERPELADRLRRIMRNNGPAGLAAMARGMALRVPADDIAGDLHMPVLVVAGALDSAIPLEESRATAAAFPNGRLEICEHSGHMPMLEEPGRVAAALNEIA